MANDTTDLQALIESVKCELRETSLFSEADLSALDFCTPDTNPLVPQTLPDVTLPVISDVMPCVDQLNSVVTQAAQDLSKAMQIKIAQAKVQEVVDNLNLVGLYYQTRYQTFNTYATDSSELVVQKNVLTQQLAAVPKSDKAAQAAIQTNLDAVNSKISQLQQQSNILSDASFNANSFLTSQVFISSLTNAFHMYCANTASAKFDPIQVQSSTGGVSFNFMLNIPRLRKYQYTDPSTGKNVTLDILSLLQNQQLFTATPVFQIQAYEDLPLPSSTKLTDVYNDLVGLLYDNTKNTGQYPGLYWKLQNPLDNLFTLDQRGLTADPTQIDPSFAATPSAAVVQDQTNDTKYYIKDVNTYQDFYQNLQQNIDTAIAHERTVVFPAAIQSVTDLIIQAANRDALYTLRLNGFLQQTIPGLQVTVTVNASTNISVDTTKLATSTGSLDATLEKFRAIAEEINNKLQDCQTEITNLSTKADGLLVTQDSIMQQINQIPCFKPQTQAAACGDLDAALGSDPLGAAMIAGGANGPSSAYPDLSSMCYWLEFAKCATLVNLIPLPGDNFTNPFKLRYWPIGLWIPTPALIIHIPLPHIWIPIFCTSTPIGTLVIFIGLCGIVPSPFLFFISPSGTKSFVLSLAGPQQNIGYSGSTIKNSIRTTSPFSDVEKVLNQNFPFNPNELTASQGSDADNIGLLDNSESVTGYLNEFKSKAIKQLDSIGDFPMRNFNLARTGGTLNSLTLAQKITIVQKDLADALDLLVLGSLSIPRDQGKLMIKEPAMSNVNDLFKTFASSGDQLSDTTHFSVKHILTQFVSQIDNGITLPKTVISKDVTKIDQNIKDKLKAFNAAVFQIALGNSTVPLSTDDLLYNNSSTLTAGEASQGSAQQLYIDLLANTITSILAGATLDLFDPFKACCQAKSFQTSTAISPVALVVLNASKVIIDQIIDSLSHATLSVVDQAANIGLGEIKSLFTSVVLQAFPDVQIPSNVNIFNFSTILGFISPVLSVITIPQVPISSLALFPAAVTFNLDGIAKVAINNLANDSKKIVSVFNLNLVTQFAQLTSDDLKSALKNFVSTSVNEVSSALSPILAPIQAIKSSNGASKTILEAAFPIMNALAEANAVVKSNTKNSSSVEFVDLVALAALASGELKVAEALFSSGASYIPVLILAATGLDSEARLLHPLFNQDDLPPWERLTVRNPLFTLFLDAFCAQAADCTAVILGRTWPT